MCCYILYNDFIAIYTRFKIRIYQFQMPYRCAKCSYLFPSKTEFPFCKEKACLVSGFQFQNGAPVICKRSWTPPQKSSGCTWKRWHRKSAKFPTWPRTVRGHQVRMTATADERWLPKARQPLLKSSHVYLRIVALTFPAASGDSSAQRAWFESIRQ